MPPPEGPSSPPLCFTNRSTVATIPPKFRFTSFNPKTQPDRRSYTAKKARRLGSRLSPLLTPMLVESSIPHMPTKEAHVVDPFNSACITVDRDVHALLHYYAEVCHPNVWKTEHCLSASKDYQFKFTLKSIIGDCLQNQMNMYAILASMASQGSFLHHMVLQNQTDYFLHKALTAFRAHLALSQGFTDRLIFNMFHLGCAEFYSYHTDGALVHLQAIKRAVDDRGGLPEIDSALRELLILGDGYIAAESLSKPLLSTGCFADLYDVPPKIAHTYRSVLGRVQAGSCTTAKALLMQRHGSFIPPDLRKLIIDLAVMVELLRFFSQNIRAPAVRTTALHWLHARNLMIRHHLLMMDTGDRRTDILRWTIVAWTLLTMSGAGRARIVKGMASKLHSLLVLLGPAHWSGVELWILLTLAMCARDGSREKQWFLSEIVRLREADKAEYGPVLWDEPGLADHCKDIFLLEHVQRPMLGDLMPMLSLVKQDATRLG